MPYSSVGPPFPLCFRGPSISPAGLDRWHSLSRHSSFLLCSFHLACPAYFQSWFSHLFYQSLLTRVHTCSKQPAPGPNWMLLRGLGTTPTTGPIFLFLHSLHLFIVALPSWAPTSPPPASCLRCLHAFWPSLSGYWGLTLQPESPNFLAVLQESLKPLGLRKYSLNILGIFMFSRIKIHKTLSHKSFQTIITSSPPTSPKLLGPWRILRSLKNLNTFNCKKFGILQLPRRAQSPLSIQMWWIQSTSGPGSSVKKVITKATIYHSNILQFQLFIKRFRFLFWSNEHLLKKSKY